MTLYITPRSTSQQGDGSNREFYYDFPVLEQAELYVYTKEDGVDLEVLRSDYNADVGPEGGMIYFTGPEAPSATTTVNIQRWVENTQTTDYVENDPFPANAHENTLDRIVMMIQQCLQFEGVGQPGAYLMWDTDGTTLINGPDAADLAYAEAHAHEATTSWSGALEAALAARNWAGGALNTDYTYFGLTSKSAYHYATLAMIYTIFPVNTTCWFGQTTAPIGWTIVPGYSDCLIGVAGTTPGGTYYVAPAGWVRGLPFGAGEATWRTVDTDYNGSFMVAGVYGGRLYKSIDFGVNWTQIIPVAGNSNWESVAVGDDGSFIIAAAYGGRLWTSGNYGINWSENRPAGNANKNWKCVASSSDSSTLYAGIYDSSSTGKLYYGSYSGALWTEIKPKGTSIASAWAGVDCSADGTRVIVIEYGKRIWMSYNNGTTWAELRPAGDVNKNWYFVECDRDASVIAVGVNGGRLYISNDYGTTWNERRPAGDLDISWSGISMNEDGMIMTAVIFGGLAYHSIDSGATWSEVMPVGSSVTRRYRDCAMSGDGKYEIVCIYDSSNYGWVYTYAAGTGEAGVKGSWNLGSHAHTQTVHSHTVGTISVSIPAHNHMWCDAGGRTTYDSAGNGVDIASYLSGNTSTGMIIQVTKANSRVNNTAVYTNNATGAGGSATGSTSNSGAVNTGTTDLAGTWRPIACLGIVAKLTTLPVA